MRKQLKTLNEDTETTSHRVTGGSLTQQYNTTEANQAPLTYGTANIQYRDQCIYMRSRYTALQANVQRPNVRRRDFRIEAAPKHN